MKIKILLLTCICVIALAFKPFAQTNWIYSDKLAKGLAVEKDQLIMMDFWASWCGPCKKMDSDMWNNPEYAHLTKNVIPLKINFDENRSLATLYGVTSIPRVILMTASGDVVAEITGFGNPKYHAELLEAVPASVNGLNKLLMTLSEDYDEQAYVEIAEKAQELALELDGPFKSGFFRLSDDYFKDITKQTKDENLEHLAEMNMLLNDAYLGSHKKAIRKVEKIDLADNSDLKEFKNFILAYCFKCDGDQTAFNEAKKKITSEKYLSQLE